jgi:hypothetical protein
MGYLEGMLASGEEPIRRERQHWFVLIADARYAILGFVLAIVAFWLSTVFTGSDAVSSALRTLLGWVALGLIVFGLIYAGWQALRYLNEEYVVTTRRVLQMEGVVNKRVIDSSLEKINDAIFSQGFFGRLFDFGDLDILTASEQGISRLRMIREPAQFKRAMLEAKHDLELSLAGGRPMPSPPLRAAPSAEPSATPPPAAVEPSPAPVAAAAAAAPAPAAPVAPPPAAAKPSSDDITRTLASLADLRDRGAISAEEYEAKKAELLGRL